MVSSLVVRYLHVGPLLVDDALDVLAEQSDVERLFEGVVEALGLQAVGVRFIFEGEGEDECLFVGCIAAKVLGNLNAFAAAHGEIDDDRVRVEAFGLDACFETTVGDFKFELFIFGQVVLHLVDEGLLGTDDEDLVPTFFFQFTQRHAMLFEEADEVFTWNASILAAGDAIATEPTGVEPFGNGAWCHLAYLGHLPRGKDLAHCLHLMFAWVLLEPVVWCGNQETARLQWMFRGSKSQRDRDFGREQLLKRHPCTLLRHLAGIAQVGRFASFFV